MSHPLGGALRTNRWITVRTVTIGMARIVPPGGAHEFSVGVEGIMERSGKPLHRGIAP